MDEFIEYVPKEFNPPNVPKTRPIESFWGNLCAKVYEGGWEAKSKEQLKRRIRKKIKEFSLNDLQSLMGGIKRKLRILYIFIKFFSSREFN